MASSLRSRFSRAFSLAESATDAEAEKYKLRVTAGPSYAESTHKPVLVNTEEPTFIENEFIRAKIVVRVKGFRGLPSSCPPTAKKYFGDPMHERDMYSLGFSFVPKVDLPSEGTVWGNDLDHPIRNRIPPGFNTAFRIVKEFIDPGLSCDVYADEPWLYGPSLSCWFAFRIGEKIADGEDFPAPGAFTEGADGSGAEVREKSGIPENNEKRRKHFLDASHREAFTFEKGRVYQGDFFNPYIDFANFSLKLPGFSLKVIRYIGEKTHCLRYVFKNRETGDLYFNVNFNLLWGEQLTNAVEEDEKLLANGTQNREEETRAGAEKEGGWSKAGAETNQVNGDASGEEPHTNGTKATPVSAEYLAKKKSENEVDQLLKNTSTAQKRHSLLLDEID